MRYDTVGPRATIQKQKTANKEQYDALKQALQEKMLDVVKAAEEIETMIDPTGQSEACTMAMEGELKKPSEVMGYLEELLLVNFEAYNASKADKIDITEKIDGGGGN